jgi:hypothetical protein
MPNPVSPEELAAFERDGFLVKRGLFSKDRVFEVLRGIDRMICARFEGFAPLPEAELHDGLQRRLLELQRRDRKGLGSLYDAIRKLSSFWGLMGSVALEQTVRGLLRTDTVGVVHRAAGIRLDLPHEDQWRSDWHQEYQSQISSENALVAWFSFTHVSFDMGPVRIAKGSQREGVLPVRALDPMNTRHNYTETFVIPEAERIAQRYELVQAETEPGDVVFLHFLTLHASGFNRSPTGTRVSAQLRYFDVTDPRAAARGWVGGWQDGGDFTRLHPEKVLP